MKLERILDLVTNNDLSTHKKICWLWLESGNKKEDFPKLPPHYYKVLITLKNGKKYKSFLAEINNWGGSQFIVNRMFGDRLYIDTDEVESWEFI